MTRPEMKKVEIYVYRMVRRDANTT